MMYTNSPLNDWPSAIASRFKHVVGFGGACLGARAEAVKGREAQPGERRHGGPLLANECIELSCKFCCCETKEIGGNEGIRGERNGNGNGKRRPWLVKMRDDQIDLVYTENILWG